MLVLVPVLVLVLVLVLLLILRLIKNFPFSKVARNFLFEFINFFVRENFIEKNTVRAPGPNYNKTALKQA